MDSTGPNPKLMSQGFILLVGLIVFLTIILYLKIRTGKTFHVLISKNQKLLIISLIIAFGIILLLFLLRFLFNNWDFPRQPEQLFALWFKIPNDTKARTKSRDGASTGVLCWLRLSTLPPPGAWTRYGMFCVASWQDPFSPSRGSGVLPITLTHFVQHYGCSPLYSLVCGIFGIVFLSLTMLIIWAFLSKKGGVGLIALVGIIVTIILSYINGQIPPWQIRRPVFFVI